MLPWGQGAQGRPEQGTPCKGRLLSPPVSLAACRDCGQCKTPCPAGSISRGSVPADVGWQHSVTLARGRISTETPLAVGECLASVLEGPLLPCVSSALGDGWGWERVTSPESSPSSAPQGGNPPSVALMETPFCVASWLCTYLVSSSAQTSVLAQDGISPLKTLPPAVRSPWGQPLCSAPGMGSRLPRECCDPPTKPTCGPCLHPRGQTRVSSLLGGGLSPPICCQTHECVPGHPGL